MSRSQQAKSEPIRDRNHVMTFGKYRGESIADIMDTDSQYLLWLHDNNKFFELHADLHDECHQTAEEVVRDAKEYRHRQSLDD